MEKLVLVLTFSLSIMFTEFGLSKSDKDDKESMDKFIKCYIGRKDLGDVDNAVDECAKETDTTLSKEEAKVGGLRGMCLSYSKNKTLDAGEMARAKCVADKRAKFEAEADGKKNEKDYEKAFKKTMEAIVV